MDFLNTLFINDIVNIINDYEREVSDKEISKFENKIETFVSRYIKKNDNHTYDYMKDYMCEIYNRDYQVNQSHDGDSDYIDDEFILFFQWHARAVFYFHVKRDTGYMTIGGASGDLEKKLNSSKLNINDKRHKKIFYDYLKNNISIYDPKN